jgi:hypothetical protein
MVAKQLEKDAIKAKEPVKEKSNVTERKTFK